MIDDHCDKHGEHAYMMNMLNNVRHVNENDEHACTMIMIIINEQDEHIMINMCYEHVW